MPLDELISYARGDQPADLLLTNGRVVNVLSGEIVETDVALLRSRIIGLGAYAVNFEDHPSMVLVGDGRSGEWSRFFGFPSPDRIMEQVDELQATRKVAAGG